MSSTKIQPLELWEPTGELRFKMLKCVLQCRSRTFAMAMAMETFYACRELFWQLFCKHTKPAARCTRIVELCLYLAIFWVDTKAIRHEMLDEMGHFGSKTLVLRKGIEGDVTAAMEYLVELLILVRRAISVGEGAKLFQRKTCFAKTTCRSMTDEIAENGKCPP